MGGIHRARGGLFNAFQDEVKPGLPVTAESHGVEQAVVLGAVLLEVQRQVKQRLTQHAIVMEDQRNEQPSHTPVAIQKGVDGLSAGPHIRAR